MDEATGAPAARPRGEWVAAILLLVVLAAGVAVMAMMAPFFMMAGDGCDDGNGCSESMIYLGVAVALCGPVGVGFVALVGTLLRMTRGRSGWWVPLLAAPIAAGAFAAGAALAAVGGS